MQLLVTSFCISTLIFLFGCNILMLVDTIARTVITEVPGRPSAVELKAMALRQQQQIDSQHQLLAAKEQRLRFLKAQEACDVAATTEGERLRRLRERVEVQESKLRRLRALRGQVDLQKTYNVTLSNDLDSIRALFSEKEKELSLAVAKVEALTRQLEELRRDRRGPLNLVPGAGRVGNNQQVSLSVARELEKLRRELMYRNQLSLQQDARLHLQREALQQRQAELRSVDQRILELQTRLQRKKASNLIIQAQATTSMYQSAQPNQQQPFPTINTQHLVVSSNSIHATNNSNPFSIRPSNSVYPSQRAISRGNIAAVEPYVHTPQKSAITATSTLLSGIAKHSAATANTNQQNQLIQDLTNLKLNLRHVNSNTNINHLSYAESDESKLARQKLESTSKEVDSANVIYNIAKKNEKIQLLSHVTKVGSAAHSKSSVCSLSPKSNESDIEKAGEISVSTEMIAEKGATQQLTVHSTPLSTVNKSVAVAVSNVTPLNSSSPSNTRSTSEEKPTVKPKAIHQIPSGNLAVLPRKPISSVAPTSVKQTLPKIVAHSPKINMVAPSVVLISETDKSRPALPPKPNKTAQISNDSPNTIPTVVNVINKAPISEPVETCSPSVTSNFPPNADNLPIKARPLTIRKQPMSEQPRLKSLTVGIKPMQYSSRKIEMPPAFLFPEIETSHIKDKSVTQPNSNNGNNSNNSNISIDEIDKLTISPTASEERLPEDVKRRIRHSISDNGKTKLARRVSFDPLALLLDASLEGELELVKKTAMQVTNPSAANDEGITALHNAICAGHFEIVKFLVEFGCDVNAQDSDGWTPLHCAASCNNLAMVKFLVESGACLFAVTLSDHETPAEKCEEDEEGFDGCSEYLYSIQEKLGILNTGEVYSVFCYDAQQTDELSFTVNDRLTIIRKGDDAEREWWWAKNSNEIEGYVPRNLLGLYPRVPLQSSKQSD